MRYIILLLRCSYLSVAFAFLINNINCLSFQSRLKARISRRQNIISLDVINPKIMGGVLSGGLHAITGPDHLAALLPTSLGKSGLYGLRIGALWGFGHGISAMIIGLGAFFLKGKISSKFEVLEKLSSLAETIVGASLIIIGLTGIKESFDNPVENSEHASLSNNSNGGGFLKSSKAIFVNGLLVESFL